MSLGGFVGSAGHVLRKDKLSVMFGNCINKTSDKQFEQENEVAEMGKYVDHISRNHMKYVDHISRNYMTAAH